MGKRLRRALLSTQPVFTALPGQLPQKPAWDPCPHLQHALLNAHSCCGSPFLISELSIFSHAGDFHSNPDQRCENGTLGTVTDGYGKLGVEELPRDSKSHVSSEQPRQA